MKKEISDLGAEGDGCPSARLIAAAPELLQSVIALLKIVDKTVVNPGDRKIIWTAIKIAQRACGEN